MFRKYSIDRLDCRIDISEIYEVCISKAYSIHILELELIEY